MQMAKFSTWLNIIFSGYSVSNCLLVSKCLDQCTVDSKPCKPEILPYLNKHIGLLKAKTKKGLEQDLEGIRWVKKKKQNTNF